MASPQKGLVPHLHQPPTDGPAPGPARQFGRPPAAPRARGLPDCASRARAANPVGRRTRRALAPRRPSRQHPCIARACPSEVLGITLTAAASSAAGPPPPCHARPATRSAHPVRARAVRAADALLASSSHRAFRLHPARSLHGPRHLLGPSGPGLPPAADVHRCCPRSPRARRSRSAGPRRGPRRRPVPRPASSRHPVPRHTSRGTVISDRLSSLVNWGVDRAGPFGRRLPDCRARAPTGRRVRRPDPSITSWSGPSLGSFHFRLIAVGLPAAARHDRPDPRVPQVRSQLPLFRVSFSSSSASRTGIHRRG